MNFAIVGCGLIGLKRLRSFGNAHRLVAASDLDSRRAQSLASQAAGAVATEDYREAITHPGVQAVVVATTNEALAEVTLAAVEAGKHVIVEKPAARSVAEIQPVIDAARKARVIVQTGFNHRFHPALQRARALVDSGETGPLMFIRGRYGHGGRIGYNREWRADPARSGGGELIDQGVHLIDLARWFLGDFTGVRGHAATFFWDMPVDDNAFLSLRTETGQTAWLQASCTEWKNMFSFEIYGRGAKLQIDGLGGSYGVERIAFYKMLPQMGPPDTTIWEYPGEDTSWRLELAAFTKAVETGIMEGPSLDDAAAVLKIVEEIYGQS